MNDLRVAEEQNYLFSFDITSPTKALRAALNRERSNVGRTAYTDRVKAILPSGDDEVADARPVVPDAGQVAQERVTGHDLDHRVDRRRVALAGDEIPFRVPWLDALEHRCRAIGDPGHADEWDSRAERVATLLGSPSVLRRWLEPA